MLSIGKPGKVLRNEDGDIYAASFKKLQQNAIQRRRSVLRGRFIELSHRVIHEIANSE
jgi:hypothetical protein